MDVTILKRDPARVKSYLKNVEIKDSKGATTNKQVVTTKGCKIMIPVRFASQGLANISSQIYICGIFATIVEDAFYAINLTNAMFRITPTSTEKVDVNDEPYYLFIFDPGSVVIDSTLLVKNDTLVADIYGEIIAKARVPWYLGYLELAKLFESAQKFAGVRVGSQPEVDWMLVSIIARDPKDISRYYRTTIKQMSDLQTSPPDFVPLQNVSATATNTFTRIGGNYFNDGVRSSLINDSTRSESIEALLTK